MSEQNKENPENYILNQVATAFYTELHKKEAMRDLKEYFELSLRTKEERANFLEKLRIKIERCISSSSMIKSLPKKYSVNLETNRIFNKILTELLIEEAPDSTVTDAKSKTAKDANKVLG